MISIVHEGTHDLLATKLVESLKLAPQEEGASPISSNDTEEFRLLDPILMNENLYYTISRAIESGSP